MTGRIIENNLFSEIVNNKKQIILKVDQTSDYVFPNELYKYQIYCKNVSGETIEDVHIKVINPAVIAIREDSAIPPEGIEIGDLNNGQSHLLYLPARCSETGEFVVHFICYGKESGLFVKSLKINCNYNTQSNKTIHKIHIYNFTPYEDTYELRSKDYNEDVTQLIKKQKLPYKAKEAPFPIEEGNLEQNIIIDESQSYLDQKDILYGDKYNTDEHTYQYLERENFNEDSVESFEGENLIDIFNQINEHSKFFKAKFLRTGTNYLFNDFREYNPDGFIYRFGLMNSEIFHHLGVIPEYTYMNDYLFRWAAEGKLPQNLYPKRVDMNWDYNKWAGHGYHVFKVYTDEYKAQIIDSKDYEPCYEFIRTFETLETAQQYIRNENNFDIANEYYIETEEGTQLIRKYKYIIEESYFDHGVFFVNIALKKIPTNFLLLDIDDIEAIIEKTKPYGMKALIRYIVDAKFDIELGLKTYPIVYPQVSLSTNIDDISYSIIPYQYDRVKETICYFNQSGTKKTKTINTIKKVPHGTAYSATTKISTNPKIEVKNPNIKTRNNVEFETEINNQGYKCKTENKLTKFSEIKDLLYQGNFEDISFYIPKITTKDISRVAGLSEEILYRINETNYQLWIESLYDQNGNKNVNPHSCWWDISLSDNKYKINNKNIDFLEIPLRGFDLRKHGVESGIGFEDSSGKLHGISAEKEEESDDFLIKYTTSKNKNFKIKKQGMSDVIGLAFKFIRIKNNTLVVFFLKKEENNQTRYYYFNYIIVNKISSLFCFTRNDKKITSVKRWSSLIRFSSQKDDPQIIFNTPQYDHFDIYDPDIITTNANTVWKDVNRIDRNEHSYSIAQNLTENEISTDDILLHFDNFNIPKDSIIKDMKLKVIGETNSYKSIYPMSRIQDGFITQNSESNNLIIYPGSIECFPVGNHDTDYYQEQLQISNKNETKSSIKFYEDKIIENQLFDDSLELSLDFLDNFDEYITISKPFWICLSDFENYDISMNEISNIELCIEGYNDGKEIYFSGQLKQDDLFSNKSEILIPSGYFKKQISLNFYNKFTLNDVQTKFRFKDLNNDLKIFDIYMNVEFKRKQDIKKEFIESSSIPIEKKKIIEIPLIESYIPGYLLENGFTAKLQFDDLEIGEYYRIYSIELDVKYRKQNIDFLVNSNFYQDKDDLKKKIVVVGGKKEGGYFGGMFFDEVIMPGAYQSESTLNTENQGIELQDALYQSFIATTNNMTGVTIYPNGFRGNPDVNLKIALYENKGNTPNKLIKEIRVSGWSKVNDKLKNLSVISYDFNVNNLKIGEKYWLKIEVDTPIENNYYLLKYTDIPEGDMKLLTKRNNNLINTFGCLKFHINTIDSYVSFNSIPISEDKEFVNPKAFVSINKGIGELKNIKFLKSD